MDAKKKFSSIAIKDGRVKIPIADTRIIKLRKRPSQEIHEYKDFVINGMPLSQLIRRSDPNSPAVGTLLRTDWPAKTRKEYIETLMANKAGDTKPNTVTLYVCPIDGDPECDTVTCKIKVGDKQVRWYDFEWNGMIDPETNKEETPVLGLGDYVFDRNEYESLLKSELSKIDWLNSSDGFIPQNSFWTHNKSLIWSTSYSTSKVIFRNQTPSQDL